SENRAGQRSVGPLCGKNVDLVHVVRPRSGPRRAERAEKILATSHGLCRISRAEPLDRYAARCANFCTRCDPHSGPRRAKARQKTLATSQGVPRGYQEQSPWLGGSSYAAAADDRERSAAQ